MQYVEVPCKIIILLPLLDSLRSLGLFGSAVLTKYNKVSAITTRGDRCEYTYLLRTIFSLLA